MQRQSHQMHQTQMKQFSSCSISLLQVPEGTPLCRPTAKASLLIGSTF
jgi:hypothetical protein